MSKIFIIFALLIHPNPKWIGYSQQIINKLIMNRNNYVDNVLVKLKRQYGKDETVKALSKKLRESEVKNGKLLSEVYHLENEIENLIDKKEITKIAKAKLLEDELYQETVKENRILRKKNKSLKKDKSLLINKIWMLEKT